MDRQIVNEKLESLRRCIGRIESKKPETVELLLNDADLQDIIVLNLTRAVQLCVDIGAHIIASSDERPPTTMGSTFDILQSLNIIDSSLASSMKRAVGFRNIAVHGYAALDYEIIYAIISEQVSDFQQFARAVSEQNNNSI